MKVRALLRFSAVALSAVTAATIVACTAREVAQHAPPLDRANLDTTCAACDDFYQFANGGWLKRDTIPSALPSWGSFDALQDRNQATLHDILERDAAAAAKGSVAEGSPAWKVGMYYASCMDTAAIDKLGMAPLQPVLDTIASIKTPEDLTRTLGTLEHMVGLAPWGDGATQDAKDATSMIAGLYQGGMSLPTTDYYSKTDSASQKIRDAFVAHVAKMFELMGDAPDTAAAEAKTVLAMETRFAKVSKPPVQLRDPNANYHKMSVADVSTLTPHFHWDAFFAAQGAPAIPAVDVGQPEFFKGLEATLTSVPVADWKVLLRWRAVHAAAPALSSPIRRGELPLPSALQRHQGEPPALEALREFHRRPARRAARPGVRQGCLPAGGEGAGGGHRGQPRGVAAQ